MTGAEADPRHAFGNAVDAYDEIRPGYPQAMFADLFGLLPEHPYVLEVGPGTGQATRDLLSRGAIVHAVEISTAMAGRLRQVLPSDDLHVTIGDFEVVPTPDRIVDAVFSATAYHWIAPQAQVDRPAHVLRPGGVVAIVDLNQVDSEDDLGFFDAAQPIYDRYGQPHTGPPAPKRGAVDPPIRQSLSRDERFTDVAVRAYDWNQSYSAAAYRKLMLSYSGTQMMEPDIRQALLDDMEAFIKERFDGRVTRPLVVTLTTARLRT
jgi:SAM-dependent methyltransferase